MQREKEMNSTTNSSLFTLTTTYHQPTTRLHIQRKQSLQFQKLPSTLLPQQYHYNQQQPSHIIKQSPTNNNLSSYPLFQSSLIKQENHHTFSSIPNFINNKKQTDTKTSLFLKSYHDRLKRQRKRQQRIKLSSIKDISLPLSLRKEDRMIVIVGDDDSNVNNNNSRIQSTRVNFNRNDINTDNNSKSTKLNLLNNKTSRSTNKPTLLPLSPRQQHHHQNKNHKPIQHNTSSLGSQILVFKKSQFLDTSSTQVMKSNKKDYINDQSLQLLLKQIYQIKQQQQKQLDKIRLIQQQQQHMKEFNYNFYGGKNKNKIVDNPQKINNNRKTLRSVDNLTINDKKIGTLLQSYLSKYNRGYYSISMKKKNFNLNNNSNYFSPKTIDLNKPSTQRKNEKIQDLLLKTQTKTYQLMIEKSIVKNRKRKLQKLYNFKTIDPWEIQINKKQYHFSNLTGDFVLNQEY